MRNLLLLAPGAAILLAGAFLLFAFPDSSLTSQAARGYPYVVMAAALLFAWRLERSQLLASAAVLMVMHAGLQPFALGTHPLGTALLTTFLPAGLALIGSVPERAHASRSRLFYLTAGFAPLASAAFFSAGNPGAALVVLTRSYVDPIYTDWLALPQAALAVLLLSVSVLGIAVIRNTRATEAGLFWLLLAIFFALLSPVASHARGVWMLAAGLVLVVALVEAAYALAYHDELTGLPARRALNRQLRDLEAPFSIAIIDIDNFKTFNDEHGHDVGDQVLRMVAARLGAVGGGGIAFRSGGEEFTIVFPGADKRTALPHVEAVREAVAAAAFVLRGPARPADAKGATERGRLRDAPQKLQVTISAGVADDRGADAAAVIQAADKAMYRAKRDGRNRVVSQSR